MIPTLSRYSPSKPSTSAQPALPLSMNPSPLKPPSTAVHQRSGLSINEWKRLNSLFDVIVKAHEKSNLPFFKDNKINILSNNVGDYLLGFKRLQKRANAYLLALGDPSFNTLDEDKQFELLLSKYGESIPEHDEVEMRRSLNEYRNQLKKPINLPDFTKHWQTFLTSVEEEIKRLPALSID
ncbi:MAG: hypothetical protein ACK551_00345 [Vampirovibrionales bacterium]